MREYPTHERLLIAARCLMVSECRTPLTKVWEAIGWGSLLKIEIASAARLRRAFTSSNRWVLATAVLMLWLLMPLTANPSVDSRLIGCALQAGCCLTLFVIRCVWRVRIHKNWEAGMQTMVRSALLLDAADDIAGLQDAPDSAPAFEYPPPAVAPSLGAA